MSAIDVLEEYEIVFDDAAREAVDRLTATIGEPFPLATNLLALDATELMLLRSLATDDTREYVVTGGDVTIAHVKFSCFPPMECYDYMRPTGIRGYMRPTGIRGEPLDALFPLRGDRVKMSRLPPVVQMAPRGDYLNVADMFGALKAAYEQEGEPWSTVAGSRAFALQGLVWQMRATALTEFAIPAFWYPIYLDVPTDLAEAAALFWERLTEGETES